MIDIKRRTELYIVNKLKVALPSHDFVPFTGGSESTGAEEVEPPFTVVSVTEAERTMATEGTWITRGVVQIITHHAETTSPEHSALARSVYEALASLPTFADGAFAFHGIDIESTSSADDEGNKVHADIIAFTAGVGG